MTDQVSDLSEFAKKRERTAWEFEPHGFLKDARGKEIAKYRIRSARTVEFLAALREAHDFAEKMGKASDSIFTNLVESCAILRRIVLRHDRDEPVWPTIEEMHASLAPDEITALLHHYQEVLRHASPLETDLDAEKAEGVAAILANGGPSKLMVELTVYTRAQLSELAILLSMKVQSLKREVEILKEAKALDAEALKLAAKADKAAAKIA